MPSLLQNISTNNKIQPAQGTLPVVKTSTASSESKVQIDKNIQSNAKNDYFSNKTICGSLMGLAAIGGGIFLLRGKSAGSGQRLGNNTVVAEQISMRIEETLDKIKNLKNLIHNDYIIKFKFLTEKFIASQQYEGIEPFVNNKELYERIAKKYDKYQDLLETSGNVIRDKKHMIKQNLQNLFKDPEFNELREIRKSLMKTIKTSASEDEVKIANDKIVMVNDLLINKVYPDDAVKFIELHNIDEKQILKLVKENFTSYENFISKYQSMQKFESDFNYDIITNRFHHSDKLRFVDIFPKETESIVVNKQLIQDAKEDLYFYEDLQQSYIAAIRDFAVSYRQTEAVVELKSLVKQLNSLRNSYRNAA